MKYSAYIFDFDYTLADTTNGIVESVNYALDKICLAKQTKENIRKTIGLSLQKTFEELTGINNNSMGEKFTELFKIKADNIMTANAELFTDTVKTLKYLKDNKLKTGIVTTKYHYRIDEIISKFKIHDLIDIVVGAEDVINLKPDPEGLLYAIKKLNIPREKTVYIGDSIVDAKTAFNAGIPFIAVTTGATGAEEFTAFPYKHIANNLWEIISI